MMGGPLQAKEWADLGEWRCVNQDCLDQRESPSSFAKVEKIDNHEHHISPTRPFHAQQGDQKNSLKRAKLYSRSHFYSGHLGKETKRGKRKKVREKERWG